MTPQQALDRIGRYNERLNAFVRVFDPPLTGEAPGEPTFAVKDLMDVAGVPTGGGARTPLDPNPKDHAVVVERLLQAGWSAVGKTNTVELAYGAWGTNQAVGGPWNPWDADVQRAPGGSSSGSAVAVASGLCDLALGSDTGGSVRIPAAVCGIVGLKPGQGLVSLKGVHPLSPSLDTVGVLTPTVAAAARGLEIISGPDGAQAVRGAFDAEAAVCGKVEGRRLAATAPEDLGELDPDVAWLYLEALERLRGAGLKVEMVHPPATKDASFTANGMLMSGESWRAWGERIQQHGEQMDPWVVRRISAGRRFSDEELRAALRQRSKDQAVFHTWLAQFDGLVSPTCPIPAQSIAKVDETTSPLSHLTRGANYFDLPGITVPCGLTREGMPAGLQILGQPQDEASVVTFGAVFEKVSGWDRRAPDLSGFS